uniref:Uncharacterized protein n=1 Tax=Arundo donax TaxID=35708 RepID=A0A0A8ZEE7_ARUDO
MKPLWQLDPNASDSDIKHTFASLRSSKGDKLFNYERFTCLQSAT